MSKKPTSDENRDKYGMTAEDWRRLDALTDAQLTEFRRPALSFTVRRKLHMSRETFAAAYGIPLETMVAWERHRAEPSEVELAYLRLIEREPEMTKLQVAVPAN